MADQLNVDIDIVENNKATAYFEEYIFSLVEELNEVNVKVNYLDAGLEQIPAVDTLVYTVPSTASAAEILFANCNAITTDTLTVNIVKSGETVAATNQYITSKTITAGTPDLLTEITGCVLQTGDFISADAATASRLNLKISLKEYQL